MKELSLYIEYEYPYKPLFVEDLKILRAFTVPEEKRMELERRKKFHFDPATSICKVLHTVDVVVDDDVYDRITSGEPVAVLLYFDEYHPDYTSVFLRRAFSNNEWGIKWSKEEAMDWLLSDTTINPDVFDYEKREFVREVSKYYPTSCWLITDITFKGDE